MSDLLSIELVLAGFIISATTSFGLISLWAATSTRHWFIRIAVCFATLCPLLLIPAYEPFAAFAIEGFVVTVGILAYRKRAPHHRVSLSDILLAMLLVAIAIVVAVRLPPLNLRAWLSVAMIGAAAGIATLIGALCFVSSRKKLAWSLGLFGCVATGAVLANFDWFIPSIVGFLDWPPESAPGFFEVDRPVIAWFFIPPIAAIAVTLLLFLWRSTLATITAPAPRAQPFRRVVAIGSTAIFAALLAALPLYVLGKLLTPDPIPKSIVPNPNGYEELVAASRLMTTTLFDGTLDFKTATAQQLRPEVKKCEKAFGMVASGLQKPCVVPVDYSTASISVEDMMAFRRMDRALAGQGRLAELENRFKDAAGSYQDAISFGYGVRRGGLLIDGMVGIACSRGGTEPLYFIRDKLPPDQVSQLISQLVQLDATDEPYAEYEKRDRIWAQGATGWHGHFNQILSQLFNRTCDFLFFNSDDLPLAYLTHQATIRLLICELALAQFHNEHLRWPTSLDDLIPKYLTAIPADPFSTDKAPLRYKPNNDGYVLYSVGPNRVDDGGTPPSEESSMVVPKSGDLRLDSFFAPDPDSETSGQNTQMKPPESKNEME